MKASTLFVAGLGFLGLGAMCASAPAIQPLQFDSVIIGGAAVLQAYVSNPGGTLSSATFSVSGPAVRNSASLGAITWPAFQAAGTVNFSSGVSSASPSVTWSPAQTGSYMVQVVVVGSSGTTTQYGYFETVADRFIVPTGTSIGSGADQMILDPGEIRTYENDTQPPSSWVLVQNGGSLIFWSGGRVDLKPGFHAANGSFFWAAVDHDMNGYSDVEEATDSDGDGIPDAWEIDHGLNPLDPTDASLINPDTGLTNLQTFKSEHKLLPTVDAGVQLVLRTPSNTFYGVNTSSWAISGASP